MQEQQHTTTPGTREIDPHAAIYIQSRAQMDFALVDEYAQMMRDGIEFDAAQGIEDASGAIYIFDGYHRGKAAEHINAMLRVSLKPGTKADAEWLAFGANVKHGLRRTHADIERVVKNALQHPNAAQKSDREIARHCGVDNKTIGNWRKHLERDAAAQRDDDAPISGTEEIPQLHDAPTQTEITGTERPEYTLTEIRHLVEGYLPKDPTDRASMLNNLIKQTVAGQAYEREIASLLQSNPTRACRRIDADLRKAYYLILNEPYGDAPTLADGEAHELTNNNAETQQPEAQEIAAKPQPEPEPQMRCQACRVMYPARQLTYKTGLCEACLNDQLERLAADSRLMRSVFAVLERKFFPGLLRELKREIYEEIYAPTPEGKERITKLIAEPKPKTITCEACGKDFPADQITEYNGRKLHTDCYYAEMTSTLKAHNAEIDKIADDLSEEMRDPRERVLYYKAQGLSVRKIADALKGEGITISKSAVDRIIQEQKEAQA